MLLFTRTGEHGGLWLAGSALAAGLDRPRRPVYLRAIRVVSIGYLINIAMKYLVRRPRPVLDGLPALSSTLSGLAYPSAHSTTSFAAATVLSDALPAAPVYACAAAMALSRVYVGVHYPSDIVAGALLGTTLAEVLP